MRYYIDFEKTSFNTNAFVSYDARRNRSVPFAPGELSQFLYQDADTFLREKESAVTIITSAIREQQESKAKSALYGIPCMSVMYTDGIQKGKYLAPHTHLHADTILVDDSPLELEVLTQTCPQIALYEIRRDGTPGDGRWPVIRSLFELP